MILLEKIMYLGLMPLSMVLLTIHISLRWYKSKKKFGKK
jgi:hypothetical protein